MPGCSGLDHIFPEWEQPFFPPLLLGLQVLFMLGAWLAFSWVADQRLLALTDFLRFFLFLSLVNDGEYPGDGFANENLGEFGRLTACHFRHTQLG